MGRVQTAHTGPLLPVGHAAPVEALAVRGRRVKGGTGVCERERERERERGLLF